MKKSVIDPIVLAMGCTAKLMPDSRYIVSDHDIVCKINEIDSLDVVDREGRTLLMYAVLYERHSIVKYLLEHNANLSQQDKHKFTALHFSAQVGNVEIVETLLRAGADVNSKDDFGNSPIMKCKYNTPVDVFKLLVGYGANPFQKNNFGMSAVDIFASKKDILEVITTSTLDNHIV